MEEEESYNVQETDDPNAWSDRLPVNQLCRVCANPNNFLISIFEGEGSDHELGMKINKHLPIKVCEDDDLPKHICYQCASTLIAWHDLVITCVSADNRIRQLYKLEQEETTKDDAPSQFFDNVADQNTQAEDEGIEQSSSDRLHPQSSSNRLHPISQSETGLKKVPPSRRANMGKEKNSKRNIEKKISTSGLSIQGTTSKTVQAVEMSNQKKKETPEQFGAAERSLEHPSTTVRNTEVLDDSYSPVDSFLGQRIEVINNEMKEASYFQDVIPDNIDNGNENLQCYSIYVKTDSDTEYHLCDVKEVENALQISESDPMLYNEIGEKILSSEPGEKERNPVDDTFVNSELTDHNYVQLSSTANSTLGSANVERSTSVYAAKAAAYFARRFSGMLSLPWGVVLPKPVSSTRLVSCKFCKKAFRSEAVLQTHTRIHTGVTPFFCKYCGRSFRLSLSLKQHYMVCNQTTISSNEFSHPLTKGHNNHYACTLCGKKYKLKPSLKEHLRAHMGKARLKLKCEVCGQKFLKKAQLLEHANTHENLELHSCSTCGKGFISERDLQDHSISHSDRRPYHCLICNATYKRKSHLTRHVLNHPSVEKPARAPQIRRKPGEEYKCEICDKVSTTKRLLMLHMVSHSGERNHVCPQCGKRFAQSGAMSRHMHTVHGGAKDYTCEICHQSFTAKATKENHLRIHTGEKPFQCVTCGKTFRTQQQHRVHEKIHSDARPYPCPYCLKCFRRRPHLVVHIRTHTGEKPYACPICGRGFAQKNDMTKHLNIHTR